MTHYEERLEKDVQRIRDGVSEIGDRVAAALRDSVHALLTSDRPLAYRTVLGDLAINRKIREMDRVCHAFVALHLPSAGHLRLVSSVLRLNVALERVGDYAVAISREAVQLAARPSETVARDVQLLAEQNHGMLRQAMRSFVEGNAELARGTAGMAKQLGATFDRVFADLLQEGEKGRSPIRDLFALLVVFNRLGRVGDQAKNICEETVFAVTGETKQPKVYQVLFLDERNDCMSVMAELYGRKAYAEGGRFSSAGWNPAPELAPQCRAFLEKHSYDLQGVKPRKVTTVHEELSAFHVIVSLEGDARPHLADLPFHTVLLEWDVGVGCDDPEALNNRIKVELRNLMETLRGEEAS